MFHSLSERSLSFAGDTELRVQRNVSRSVGLLNGDVVTNHRSEQSGVSARVIRNGRYGFASASQTDPDSVSRILSQASKNAAFLSERMEAASLPLSQRTPIRYEDRYVADTVSQEEILSFLMQIDEYLASHYPHLASRYVGCGCLSLEKLLRTDSGTSAYSFLPRSNVSVSLTARDANGAPIERYAVFGGAGVYASNFSDPTLLYERLDALVEELSAKCDGVFADAGRKTCVIAPEVSGILAHEAVGHTAEADFVISGSVAGPCRGKQVAAPIVSLVDFAHSYQGSPLPTPIRVDDEGIAARDAVLIDRGVLSGWMHNRFSSARYGDAPTGNALAFSFADEPLIRMRNTAILPGSDRLADMIASVEDGYYLTATGNGQADATGEFTFSITMGYEIKNGTLGRAIRDTTVSGVAFDVLKTVDMISDQMVWLNSGMCGKKQPFPVGMGGPHLKCSMNVGGK